MTLFIVSLAHCLVAYMVSPEDLAHNHFLVSQGLATTSYSSSIGSMTRQLGVSELAGQAGLTTFNGV